VISEPVISVQIERIGPFPFRIQDVGVVTDLGPHDIDLARFITESDYADVHGVISSTVSPHEDTAHISAKMENGALAMINMNWVTPYRSRRIKLATEHAFFEADLMNQEVVEYGRFDDDAQNYTVKNHFVARCDQISAELTAFLTALKTGNEMPITGEDGLASMRIIEDILKK